MKEEAGSGFSPSAPWDLVISALLFNIGFLQLAVLGKYESAAEVLQEAHSLRKTVVGQVHTLTVQAAVSRGWALTLTGKTLQAVDELTRYKRKEQRWRKSGKNCCDFLSLLGREVLCVLFFIGYRCFPGELRRFAGKGTKDQPGEGGVMVLARVVCVPRVLPCT